MLADLMRRSRQFRAALEVCYEGLKKTSGDVVADILIYQKVLVAREDTACHKVTEVGLPGASIVKRLVNEILSGKWADKTVHVYSKVLKSQMREGGISSFVLEDEWGDGAIILSGRNPPKSGARYFIVGRVGLRKEGAEYVIGEFERIEILSMPQRPKHSKRAPSKSPNTVY